MERLTSTILAKEQQRTTLQTQTKQVKNVERCSGLNIPESQQQTGTKEGAVVLTSKLP